MLESTAPAPGIHLGRTVVGNVGVAGLFCFAAWLTDRMLSGDTIPEAALTAILGFVFFGWVAVLVLALISLPAVLLLDVLLTGRKLSPLKAAVVGSAVWIALASITAALGTPLVNASGFSLPGVLPGAAIAGAIVGTVLSRRHVTLRVAD